MQLTRMTAEQRAALDADDAWVARWEREAAREAVRWRRYDTCPQCGERIGHFGGSVERDPCPNIPLNVPLEEVRPGRYAVRRPTLADAIRAVREKRPQGA